MTHHAAGWHLKNSYQQLPDKFYTALQPTSVSEPHLIMFNDALAEQLGLRGDLLKSQRGIDILAGNKLPEDTSAIAQAYAGHQFGNPTILGDGRALLIGEQITPEGEQFDIQLKGSGPTPYSRGGDGRAALGPMLREYIMSEAMHALGVPTTRGLAVVSTGESILREKEYPGAVLTRVASSHLRVGTFQFAAAEGERRDVQALADYAIERHGLESKSHKNGYLNFFETVVKRQARLIAKWQLVGFIHGVMNTDNMTISGETIDYGPCAFMDTYDLQTVFSSIDVQGRYAYGNQPSIGGWNLARFAESLLPLFHAEPEEAVTMAQTVLEKYNDMYVGEWLTGMRAKLGLVRQIDGDQTLIEDLLQLMQQYKADYTNTFVVLTEDESGCSALFQSNDFKKWHEKWTNRLQKEKISTSDIKKRMQQNNPVVIPRNHLVEEALNAAVEEDDYSVMENLLNILAEPYAYTKEQSNYQSVPKRSTPYRTFCGT